jgi:HSP20 family protein
MYRSLFPRDVLAELDRLQRDICQAADLSPNIRGIPRVGFPALNVGSTDQSVEIYAFAPGVDPATLEVHLERSLLTIGGERKGVAPPQEDKSAIHIQERFGGAFRRVMTLPEDADPEAVEARLQDGLLHITVQRRASAQPRRIKIQ